MFLYLQTVFSFAGSLRKWLAHFLLIRSKGDTYRIKHFSSQEIDISCTFLMRLRLQGYRCKSGIAIFAWRVTRNYAYSIFKHAVKERIKIFFYLNYIKISKFGKISKSIYFLFSNKIKYILWDEFSLILVTTVL